MKKVKSLIVTLLIFSVIMGSSLTVFATDSTSVETDDEALVNATIISTDSYIENDRLITKTVYQQSDGTLITDTLNVSAIAPLSKNGSDTATRTRTISEWGTITITASFQWYTENSFSYVKCNSMSASYSLDEKAVVSKFEKSYTKDYVTIGKAYAQVEYYFYNEDIPVQYQQGTFKITCTDSGTISDNN